MDTKFCTNNIIINFLNYNISAKLRRTMITTFFILILLILFLSAIFSGTEAAFLSVSVAKLKDIAKRNKKYTYLVSLKENISDTIFTIVVLNNLTNIIGSIYLGVLATKIFGNVYFGIFSALFTLILIFVSEIIPKFIGERNPLLMLKLFGKIIYISKIIFRPLIFVNSFLLSFLVDKVKRNPVTEGEIKELVELGIKDGKIKKFEKELIENVLEFDEIVAYDIMVPRNRIVTLDINMSLDEVIKIVNRTGFTRFPVLSNGDIVGIINAKDLFKFFSERRKKFDLSRVLRPAIYVTENMGIMEIQEVMKKKGTYMAIVINEHGDFVGIVTLEDIIEELLGDIEDEFDVKKKWFERINDTTYYVDCDVEVSLVNEVFGLNLDSSEFATLNGFLIDKFKRVPKVNDVCKVDGCRIRVIQANKRKALKVELKFDRKNAPLVVI